MENKTTLTWTDKTEDQIFEENQGLIFYIINKYCKNEGRYTANVRTNEEDLYQLGSIGLLKAIRTFNPECGAKFGGWAGDHILWEIMAWTNPNLCPRNRRQMQNDDVESIYDFSEKYQDDGTASDYELLTKGALVRDMSAVSYTDDTLWRLQIEELKHNLSSYDMYVLQRILDGCSGADIARELGVTRQAINHHINHIREKYSDFVD